MTNNPPTILASMKDSLGIPNDLDHFDSVILMHINTTFTTLKQLGVESKEITTVDTSTVWPDDLSKDVQTYIYLTIRLYFDPPTNAFLVDSIQKQIDTLGWRMSTQSSYDKEELE